MTDNAAAELVVFGSEHNSEGHRAASLKAEVYDLLTSATLSTIGFGPGGPPYDLETLPDRSGNGIQELAGSVRQGEFHLEVRDGLTGAQVGSFERDWLAPAGASRHRQGLCHCRSDRCDRVLIGLQSSFRLSRRLRLQPATRYGSEAGSAA